jgi:hypothetical protein
MWICGGLVKSQIDFSSRGSSAEGSVWVQPGSVIQPVDYADKEDSLSSVYLLPRHYIHICHKVCWQLAFMLINYVIFNADKAENWNDTQLLILLIFFLWN